MPALKLLCANCDERIADGDILCDQHWPLVDPGLQDLIETERKVIRQEMDRRDLLGKEWHGSLTQREQLRASCAVALKLALLKT